MKKMLTSGAVLLGMSFFLSKVLGLLRDNLLAASFGASGGSGIFNLDTYYAAFRLPDFLYNVLSYGVVSAAFVPIFVEIMHKESREHAFHFAEEILHTLSFILLACCVLFFIFAPAILRFFLPGFGAEEAALTAELTRLMLVTPILFSIGGVFGGIQNAFHRYLGLALAPLFYNIGIVLGIVFLSKTYGVYGIAYGVIAGAFLSLMIQLPGVLQSGLRFRRWPRFSFSPRVKEMIMLALPRIFGMSVTQLSLIIDTIIASSLAAGSITVINFASNIESIPIGIIGISIAVVSFGTLSSFAAEGKSAEFTDELKANIRRILFFLVPMAFGMFTLRFHLVKLLLGRGKFTLADMVQTANTLGIFLTGLIFGGIVFLLARGFYALKETKIPVIISMTAVGVNILLSIVATRILKLGTFGLAFANSIADMTNAALLIFMLNRKLGINVVDVREIAKFFCGALIMTLVIHIIILQNTETLAGLILQTTGAVSTGSVTYLGICRLLKCKNYLASARRERAG